MRGDDIDFAKQIQRKALVALDQALDMAISEPGDPGSAVMATVAHKAMDVLYKGGMTLQRDSSDAIRAVEAFRAAQARAKQDIASIARKEIMDGGRLIRFLKEPLVIEATKPAGVEDGDERI